jgi:predicted amidohydrolase YtcJ
MKLDLRLTGGSFVTMDPVRPQARSLGVWQGRIVGFDDDVDDLPAVTERDLGGATVLPGFIDPHVHLAWAGLAERSPSLTDAVRSGSIPAVLAAVEQAARTVRQGEWVDIAGYDQRPLGRHVTAAELDRVAQGRKLFLIHDSGHACAVNTAVLDLLPPGTAHQDGVLVEENMSLVRALRMPYSLAELVEGIDTGGRSVRREGVTTVSEAGLGGGLVVHSPIELAAYQRARDESRLHVRMQAMVAADALRPVRAAFPDAVTEALDLGIRTGLGDDRLSIGALKVWADGGMMARTAALTSPYVGQSTSGRLWADPDRLLRQIIEGHRAGWQLAVHAIGDAGLDLALEGLERAHALHPHAPHPHAPHPHTPHPHTREPRHRIEHAGLVRPDQLERLARLKATVVVQPNFLWSFGDDYAAIVGPERAPWLYRGQAFLDHGIRLVGSSDRPVTTGAPLRAMQFMVERLSSSGAVIGPEERIGVDDALRAYTTAAAWVLHRERDLGSLTPGKQADLVLLGDDPRAVDPGRIASIEVLGTYLAGEPLA